MGRVPEEELARIKREVPVARLAEARGVKLQRRGQDLVGLCPFHEDREPSLVISPQKNLWHCLGACRSGGSVIDWVMKAEGVSFRHAVELLRQEVPPVTGEAGPPPKRSLVPKLPPLAAEDAEDAELLSRVVEYYHETLQESPAALAYLESRDLRHGEMVEHFRLGFANRTLGYRLPNKHRRDGVEVRGRLQRLGVLRDSGHEHLAGSLVVPIFDEGERVVELYGRKIQRHQRKGAPQHLYLPGPHRGVFNRQALAASPEIILCESLLDALSFWCAGYRNVTSAYGVNGFTEEMQDAFVSDGVERVLIAYDRDAAGDEAAEKLAQRLMGAGLECFRVQFPRGMDANAYALKVRPPAKSLGLVLRQAEWMGKGPAPQRASPAEPLLESAPAAGAPSEPVAPAPVEAPPPAEPSAPSSAAPGQDAAVASPAPRAGAPPIAEASPAPVASPVPPAPPAADVPVEVRGQEVVVTLGDRRYRVRGLDRNTSYDLMKVNLLAARAGAFHVDTFDLYAARQRVVFVKQAAAELQVEEGVIKKDLGRVLLKLEELQDQQLRATLEPEETAPAMTEEERAEALALLRDPDLPGRILEDFARCGVVGEETNKLVGYLTAVSRKLEEPLAVIVQSSSAAGKTSLMEAVLALAPEEERVQYSAMTGQSLFYMGERDLQHKLLAIVEEEGAERASYALKLLQSEGELTIASTGKDPHTGRLVTQEYRVEGPVALFLTTTSIELDEELENRCLRLTVDEGREQTRAIHRLQREKRTLEGLFARRERQEIRRRHRNAQRLLEPLPVVNPYARKLTFLDTQTRTRRDHEKYLTLIDTIALLHQHQREVQTERWGEREERYLEVTLGDIELANRLAGEVLGRSLDELPPQTRGFLERLEAWVAAECERQAVERGQHLFTARQVREALGLGATQVKLHLRRLWELEYLVVHRGGRGLGFVYELVYRGEGEDGRTFLPGLIDVEKLRGRLDSDSNRSASEGGWSGQNGERSGGGRPPVGPRSGGGRGGGRGVKSPEISSLGKIEEEEAENAHLDGPRGGSTDGVESRPWAAAQP